MNCPGCATQMTARTLRAHLGTSVVVDACLRCQAFWFDGFESLQLTPGSTLELFRFIGDETAADRRPMRPFATCPRCDLRLQPVEDTQRTTRFRYGRCPRGHGRFITFFNFLREKNFIKALSARQLADLRAQVQTVNCSNCGAPVDLQTTSECAHCGAPLSMFDLKQAESLITQLRSAGSKATPPGTAFRFDALGASREADEASGHATLEGAWFRDAASAGTVAASVMALARWLERKV